MGDEPYIIIKDKSTVDGNLFFGILKAIMSFSEKKLLKNSDPDNSGGIEEIQMQGKNVLIDKGEKTFLATVFSGKSCKKLYLQSRKVLDSLEFDFKDDLKVWNGDINKFIGSKKIIGSIFGLKTPKRKIIKKKVKK